MLRVEQVGPVVILETTDRQPHLIGSANSQRGRQSRRACRAGQAFIVRIDINEQRRTLPLLIHAKAYAYKRRAQDGLPYSHFYANRTLSGCQNFLLPNSSIFIVWHNSSGPMPLRSLSNSADLFFRSNWTRKCSETIGGGMLVWLIVKTVNIVPSASPAIIRQDDYHAQVLRAHSIDF